VKISRKIIQKKKENLKVIDDVKLIGETSGEKLFKICGFIYCLLDVKQVDAEYITILIKLN
jgi:hypothetical protein